MRYRIRAFSLALMIVGASAACRGRALGGNRGVPPSALPTPTASGVPSTGATSGTAAVAARKRVEGKEEPATLIATDRSRCTVTPDRFRNTQIGDNVICAWTTSDRSP